MALPTQRMGLGRGRSSELTPIARNPIKGSTQGPDLIQRNVWFSSTQITMVAIPRGSAAGTKGHGGLCQNGRKQGETRLTGLKEGG
jgi:hypothetical protein